MIDFNSSECLNENIGERNYLNRIVEHSISEDIHNYEIFVVTNCSRASEGEVELKNDTLNLIYHGYRKTDTIIENKTDSTETLVITEWVEEYADCDCAFNLKYKIKGLKNMKYVVLANNKPIQKTEHKYPVKQKPAFDIIDNDTINYIDIYGHKQGLHIWRLNDNRIYAKINFKDNVKFSGLSSTKYNFDEFEKIEIYMDQGEYTKMKYYKNGEVFKICDTEGVFFEEGTNCIYPSEKE